MVLVGPGEQNPADLPGPNGMDTIHVICASELKGCCGRNSLGQ